MVLKDFAMSSAGDMLKRDRLPLAVVVSHGSGVNGLGIVRSLARRGIATRLCEIGRVVRDRVGPIAFALGTFARVCDVAAGASGRMGHAWWRE